MLFTGRSNGPTPPIRGSGASHGSKAVIKRCNRDSRTGRVVTVDIAFDDRGLNWQSASCRKNCTAVYPSPSTSCFYYALATAKVTDLKTTAGKTVEQTKVSFYCMCGPLRGP